MSLSYRFAEEADSEQVVEEIQRFYRFQRVCSCLSQWRESSTEEMRLAAENSGRFSSTREDPRPEHR